MTAKAVAGVLVWAAVITVVIDARVGALALLASAALARLLSSRRDPVAFLTVAVCLLLLMPARLRLAGLGAIGTPASLAGLLALVLWVLHQLRVRGPRQGQQPVHWAVALFVLSVVASYAAACLRAPDALEAAAADRGLFTALCSAGLALYAADRLTDADRLRTLVRRIVAAGTVMATLGVIHFIVGVDLVGGLAVPGFNTLVSDWDNSRSGFSRISSTAEHPIELSVVLAMLLPLALHVARNETGRMRRVWWGCVVLIGATLPMTVSRTSVVAVGVVLFVIALRSSWPERRRGLKWILVFLVLFRLAVPGLLGTLRSLFSNAGQDDSVGGRVIDYAFVGGFIDQRPLFGRGFATFLPSRYAFLDNQMLLSLVETGFLGLVAVLAVFLTGVSLGFGTRRRSLDPELRGLGDALAAALLAALVTSLTYDSLSFGTGRGLTFLFLGMAGACWRLAQEPRNGLLRTSLDSPGRPRTARTPRRRTSGLTRRP